MGWTETMKHFRTEFGHVDLLLCVIPDGHNNSTEISSWMSDSSGTSIRHHSCSTQYRDDYAHAIARSTDSFLDNADIPPFYAAKLHFLAGNIEASVAILEFYVGAAERICDRAQPNDVLANFTPGFSEPLIAKARAIACARAARSAIADIEAELGL